MLSREAKADTEGAAQAAPFVVWGGGGQLADGLGRSQAASRGQSLGQAPQSTQEYSVGVSACGVKHGDWENSRSHRLRNFQKWTAFGCVIFELVVFYGCGIAKCVI